ncbi:TrmH family RNA methyltransferase [Streptomonospora litoralis]|uniref:tRNA (Guanosine(18)-2'-O)-methyltransferase n=1 Tax=Streptomonospora litoralis TaxID=2498135 RepID=A0A4P6Q5T3_9ACTN|nr:TrmH family RNA methyltransferase [Streptomonospora litoralis]QBI54244.1 tRNA (guanosine(18)-2'-O)-methyltransferase [Streptomonospora litoralis]
MSTQLRPTDVKRLNRHWRRRTEGRIALIVESVTQPFNLGSILRTCATFGVETVWLAGNSADPTHPQVGKTALGTEHKLHWEKVPQAAEAVAAAHAGGFRVAAIELARGAVPLHEAPLEGDVCLAVGAEDHGCSPALLSKADTLAYIPQIGRVGSLNVAVAAAVAIAETRQREWRDLPATAEDADAAEAARIR